MRRRITRRRNNSKTKKRKRSTKKKVKENKFIKYDLFNGHKWDNYRLGDVIYCYFA